MPGKLTIRPAEEKDIPALTAIYNQAIAAGYCTCDTEPFTPSQRIKWFEEHNNTRYPLFTALTGQTPAGYACFSAYRPGRKAVAHVAEISYYLDFTLRGKGYGELLLEFILRQAPRLGFDILLAILLENNPASLNLLKKKGFEEWGRLPGIVDLNGSAIDHLYYGKRLAFTETGTGTICPVCRGRESPSRPFFRHWS